MDMNKPSFTTHECSNSLQNIPISSSETERSLRDATIFSAVFVSPNRLQARAKCPWDSLEFTLSQ
ncbi:MAG: hypothetical protein ACMUJM_23485 [bacterium]